MRYALIAILAATWKQALATGATAAVVASQIGSDPIPWAIGAFGASIMAAYRKKAAPRPVAWADAGVSIMIGGLVAPFAASVASVYWGPVWNQPYVAAAVFSPTWAYVARRWVIPKVDRVFGKDAKE